MTSFFIYFLLASKHHSRLLKYRPAPQIIRRCAQKSTNNLRLTAAPKSTLQLRACTHAYRRGYCKRLSKEAGEGGRGGGGGVSGAVGPKDVSLPVCHKSSVLLCDRLADRASSVSSGTPGYCYTVTLLFFLLLFLRCGSCLLKQRRKRGTPLVWCLGADTQLSHVRLLSSV